VGQFDTLAALDEFSDHARRIAHRSGASRASMTDRSSLKTVLYLTRPGFGFPDSDGAPNPFPRDSGTGSLTEP
jgi:hypothetical protein